MSKSRRLTLAQSEQLEAAAKQPPSPTTPPVGTLEYHAWRGARYDELLRDLRMLATRDDGWLRLIPATTEQKVYLKWKFTRGKWEQHYIWVTTEDMQVHLGLQLLLRKLQEVDLAQRKPTKDKLYGEES